MDVELPAPQPNESGRSLELLERAPELGALLAVAEELAARPDDCDQALTSLEETTPAPASAAASAASLPDVVLREAVDATIRHLVASLEPCPVEVDGEALARAEASATLARQRITQLEALG